MLEALSLVDVMTRANVTCTMVGMDKLEVESSHHIKVVMDCLCDENIETYDALVIPGGLPGATNLRDDKRVIDPVSYTHLDVYKRQQLARMLVMKYILI